MNGNAPPMRKAFSKRLKAFEQETGRGLDAIRARFAGKTPAEQALADLEAQRTAQDLADQFAEAQQIQDPVERARRLAELNYQQQVAALQAQAELERWAARISSRCHPFHRRCGSPQSRAALRSEARFGPD